MKETAAERPVTCAEIADRGLIERYVAGTLGAKEAEALESHLLDCPHCQSEVRLAVAIRGALRQPASAARRRRVGLLAGAGLALAAGLATVMLLPGGPSRQQGEPGQVTTTRGDGDAGVPALVVMQPASGAVVNRDSVAFVWRRVGVNVSYRLTLTTDTGDVLWSGLIAETTATLPRAVRLRKNRAYAWFVDALLPDGRSTTSGVQGFRTAP